MTRWAVSPDSIFAFSRNSKSSLNGRAPRGSRRRHVSHIGSWISARTLFAGTLWPCAIRTMKGCKYPCAVHEASLLGTELGVPEFVLAAHYSVVFQEIGQRPVRNALRTSHHYLFLWLPVV